MVSEKDYLDNILKDVDPVIQLDEVSQVSVLPGIMAVCNSHWNPALLCALQSHRTQAVLMHMNDPIFRMGLKKALQISAISRAPRDQPGHRIDSSAHAPDFRVIVRLKIPVNQKIKLYLCSVDMPVIIHQHGLQPPASHISHYLQYPDHSITPHAVCI